MTENNAAQTPALVLTETASAIVKSDVRAFKSDGRRYLSYVTEMGVTAETVADHVAIFRDAFRAMTPDASGAQVKAYATKVRNGLNYHCDKTDDQTNESGETTTLAQALLTKAGFAATREQVIAAWESAQV